MESLLRVRAREDREEWARAMLPWVICRKTVRERPEFVQLMLQRSLDNPYPTSLAGLRRQAEAIGAHDTLDRLGAIRVPTLVTLGAEDILVPPAFSREVHARIPGAELTVRSPTPATSTSSSSPTPSTRRCWRFSRSTPAADRGSRGARRAQWRDGPARREVVQRRGGARDPPVRRISVR